MNHFKLIIIGAGASGLAAASKLLKNGFSDFRILEAEGRIGGRVHSTTLDNLTVELGAEWIHGQEGNVVYELASKYNLQDDSPLFDEKDDTSMFLQTNFFDSSGCHISKEISIPLTEAYLEVMRTDGKDLSEKVLNGSIGDYFDIEFQKKITELKEKINIDDKLIKKFIKVFENWENSINAAHSWYETSLCGHLEYCECPGSLITRWKNCPYSTLFNLLAMSDSGEKFPIKNHIIFNKEVSKVKWNKECKMNIPNVTLECLDGSMYSADYILVTCSLGVLKEKALDMFSPSLPEKKLQAIQNLGFGTVDKIFLKFSHCWWKDNNGFAFLWSEEERQNDSSGWLHGVICFHPIHPEQPVLRGWITAEAAQFMESLSNSEIVEGISYLFNKFLGSSGIPPIDVCLTSNWYSNAHFRGSYSCRLIQSEACEVWAFNIAEPVCDVKEKPIVCFAGEASHDHFFSTVHGAVEAGYREAKRLLPFIIYCNAGVKLFSLNIKSTLPPSSKSQKLNFLKIPVTLEDRPKQEQYKVAIVGAGISGLAAAKLLSENGVTSLIVIEAQSKPGGRIRSIQVDGVNLELGAQWIHGDKNEVYDICKENNLVTEEYSSEGEGLYLRENGEKISEEIVKEVDGIVKTILENCENYVSSSKESEIPLSIGNELFNRFDEYLESRSEDSKEIKTIRRELFYWHIRYQLIDNSCSDLCNLSARAWGLFKFCGGNDYVNFRNGYSSLIDFLVNCLPENTITYKTCVECIDWREEVDLNEDTSNPNQCNVKITCNNGSTFFSQYVIVTSSLGYLKNNYKTMFNPPLPSYLTEAIEFLDFGTIDKIFLLYKKPWWDPEIKGFQLVWSIEDSPEANQHWARYMTGFDVLKDKPILLGWVGGEGAKIVEQMSEEDVGREATEILQKFTKNPNIPLPEKVIRTEWWSNEYIRGGYSHITVKCDESQINGSNLAQPVYSTIHKAGVFKKPTILLAGESTHKNYFSTVHGAFESGQMQARVILQHIQNHSK